MPNDNIFDHPDLAGAEWAAKERQQVRRSFWRRHRLRLSVLLVLAVVIAGAVVYNVFRPKDAAPAEVLPASSQGSVTTTGTATSTAASFKVDLRQPFLGTPAAGWGDGEAGIVVPQAVALNGFPAAKVAEALDKARTAFIESRLDRKVVQDNNIDSLVNVFAPDAQKAIRDEPAYRNRIKPGFKLIDGVAPKVSGKMTVEAGKKGELVIHLNYVVAYAFYTDKPEDLTNAMDIVVVERSDQQYVFHEDETVAKSSWGLWPDKAEGYLYSMACTPAKEGLIAPAYSERRLGLGPETSASVNAFDPNSPIRTDTTC